MFTGGPASSAAGSGATALGAGAYARDFDTAVGYNARVTANATGSVALGQGSVADEANSVSVGSAANQRRITHVAAGTNPTDAVNLRQLTGTERRLDSRITNLEQEVFSGIASIAALAAIPSPAYGRRNAFGIAYGNYTRGENAFAIGYKGDLSDRLRLTAGLARANNAVTTNVGLGWSW